MRKHLTIVAAALVVTLMVTASPAQVVATDAYQLAYYDNFVGFHAINTGQIGSPIDPGTKQGTICADIYLFDANQEMMACCSCALTANALVDRIAASSLTGVPFTRGVVKVVADAGCDETSIPSPVNGGLRLFQTNIQPPIGTATENPYQSAPLTVQEQQFLGQACAFTHYLGSGRGVCDCSTKDF